MRFDTHRISSQLVNELQKGRPHVEVAYDGGDLIRVSLESNEIVHIYFIENPITVYEIRGIVAANTGVGIYSLFILWRDLLLPIDGAVYRPDDWMALLLALHGNKIYAFDAYMGEENYIFPIYFEGTGAERRIRHGTIIDATKLVGEMVITRFALMEGVWRMANFEPHPAQQAQSDDDAGDTRPVVNAMTIYFERLGLKPNAGREAVKRAFRRLARKYHPDLNTDPSATKQMQVINEAYTKILEELDKQDGGSGG
ncbi:MAG: DnaJ domain-containing protein [Chloroflexi bacterium]|nr:DnaJ domain-containing protein [Chloroflexota bacterium]